MTAAPAKATAAGERAFWRDGLLQRLGTTSDELSDVEATERLRCVGPNLVVTCLRRGVFFKVAKQLVKSLIALLLIAALTSALTLLGHSFGFIALPAPVLLAILVIAAFDLGFAEMLKPLAMRAEGKRRSLRARHLGARRFRAF